MAYKIGNISTLDLRPSTAIGVKIPFSGRTAFTSVYTTKEQLKYNIINFLLSDPRERPFNPTFGAGLRSRIFEQLSLSTAQEIESSLTIKIENNFPNIKIANLVVSSEPDKNLLIINFSYSVINTGEIDEASVVIQNT